MKLFICGNGFDLHHGFQTSYNFYRDFLSSFYPDIYSDTISFELETGNDLWSDVENGFYIDYEDFISKSINENYPDISDDNFHDSAWSDIEIDIENRSRISNDGFTDIALVDWLYHAYCPNKNAPKDENLNISNEDYFINFNYTPTLEKIYNIPGENIFHIHGSLLNFQGVNLQEINSTEIRKEIQFGSPDLAIEDIDKAMKNYQDDDFYAVSIEPIKPHLEKLYEATSKNIQNNYIPLKNFISNKSFSEVVILGHSFDKVDKNYYRDIICKQEHLINIPWTFYIHPDARTSLKDQINTMITFCNELGIKKYSYLVW